MGNTNRAWGFGEAGQSSGSEVCGTYVWTKERLDTVTKRNFVATLEFIFIFLKGPNDSIWVHWVGRCCLPHYTMSLAHDKHPLVIPTNIILNLFFVKRYFWFNCPLKTLKLIVMHLIFPFSGFLCKAKNYEFTLLVQSLSWSITRISISVMSLSWNFHHLYYKDMFHYILFLNFLFFLTWLWVFSWIFIRI